MKKLKLTIINIISILFMLTIVLLFVKVKNNGTQVAKPQQDNLRERIYFYMKDKKNQNDVYKTAIALNGGKSANTCVYFLSEVLRRNNITIPKQTANISQIMAILNKMGWKKDTDYKNLQSGDIGFTTDSYGNKNGIPTHTYIFMGWIKEGNYDFAYIVDNQAKDYDNQVYHKVNIKNVGEANGNTKEAFSFFMKP